MLARLLYHLANLHRRMLGVYFAVLGPRISYAVTRALARGLYGLVLPLRAISEAQCRAGLAGHASAADAIRIAKEAFIGRMLCLTDLLLADRLLHRGTYKRYGGAIPEPFLSQMLDAQHRRQPAILLTAYYGPFDLWPILLGLNGVNAVCIYKMHLNKQFDWLRTRIRARGGCELVPIEQAAARVPAVLQAGGAVALVADHPAERRGVPVTFLGLPATAQKTVGLLAQQYGADVVVAVIRRRGAFRFEIDVEDIIKPPAWNGADDPMSLITHRYIAGLERLILKDPSQYLWAQARWGERMAQSLTGARPEPSA